MVNIDFFIIKPTILKLLIEESVEIIYVPEIGDLNFIWNNEKYEELVKYYKKHPQDLATEYIKNPNNLNADERERLAHEANYEIRQFLENNIEDPTDKVLSKINERFKVKLKNGFNLIL